MGLCVWITSHGKFYVPGTSVGECMSRTWRWKSHAQPRNVNQAEGFVQCVQLHGTLNIVFL